MRTFIILFSIFAILLVLKTNYARLPRKVQIPPLRLYFHLFKDEQQKKLLALNMLEIAKNEHELTFWVKVLGPKLSMNELLNDSGGGTSLDCHTQAHLLGRVAYEEFGRLSFKEGNSLCHSGYYHGAMEAFLRDRGTRNIGREIGDLCKEFETSFGQFECYHGVGHGVLAYEDYDLPKALTLCRELHDPSSKQSCFGGVFMENVVTSQGKGADPTHTTEWVSADPHFPCNNFANDYDVQFQCYNMQTSRMLILFGNNFGRVLSECLRAPDNMKHACFRSFGRDAAGQVLRDPEKIIHLCGKVKDIQTSFVNECVIGALNVIIDFWGESLKDEASQFCSKLPISYKTTCYQTLANRLPGLFTIKEKQELVCKTFQREYKNLCGQRL